MYPDSAQELNYETDDAVYFFTLPYEPLNNWSAHRVTIWGKTFPTLEHGFHYRKYSDKHPEIAEEIANAPSPWAAMQVDRHHRAKRRHDWQEAKVGIMTELMRAKIEQNPDVKERLLATGSKTIVENSPWDDFWGAGKDGRGQNRMGKILMHLRDELQK
jgi:ribA/ribD-fused uncharacterized protein